MFYFCSTSARHPGAKSNYHAVMHSAIPYIEDCGDSMADIWQKCAENPAFLHPARIPENGPENSTYLLSHRPLSVLSTLFDHIGYIYVDIQWVNWPGMPARRRMVRPFGLYSIIGYRPPGGFFADMARFGITLWLDTFFAISARSGPHGAYGGHPHRFT